MKKLDLNALGVEEMNAGEANEINGGLSPYQNSWGNESNFGGAGEFLLNCVEDLATVKSIWELFA